VETDELDQQRIVDANVRYHSALAENYSDTQPHYSPENLERVDGLLAELAKRTGGGSLLDVGCGTGFVLDLAKNHFDRVVGVDITPAMLDRVDTSGNVEVFESTSEAVPFGDGEFDACTAYGFLHHLFDVSATIREAARVLRSGGVFFSDQDPSHHYWALMQSMVGLDGLDGFVAREVRSVVDVADDIAAGEAVSARDVTLAEYQKVELGGFDPTAMIDTFHDVGFSTVSCRYEWFLGQGAWLHERSADDTAIVEAYLRQGLPATKSLFKYVSFDAVRD
jgi:SAM-dependent methyltransferase